MDGLGNNLVLKVEMVRDSGSYTTVAGLQTKSAKIGREQVETTDHGDNLFRKLLEGAGVASCDISAEGFYDNDDTLKKIRDNAIAGVFMNCQFIDPVSDQMIQGLFAISNFEWTADLKKEQRFAASFQSSGTYTAGDATP